MRPNFSVIVLSRVLIAPSFTASFAVASKERKQLEGADVLIAYIDQSDKSREIEIVPCRYATLVDVASLGQTANLQLEVQELAHVAELATLNPTSRADVALGNSN
jgi:hypothetical protein